MGCSKVDHLDQVSYSGHMEVAVGEVSLTSIDGAGRERLNSSSSDHEEQGLFDNS